MRDIIIFIMQIIIITIFNYCIYNLLIGGSIKLFCKTILLLEVRYGKGDFQSRYANVLSLQTKIS